MPTYEYQCPKCGVFEVDQRITEAALKAQPNCPHKNCPCTAERIISAPAVHFKGTGFYKTDYTSGKTAPEKKTESKDKEKASDASTDSSTDKKKPSGGSCGPKCGCH